MSQSSEAAVETFESFDDAGGEEFETFDTMAPIEEDEIKEPTKKEKVSEDLKVIKDSQADSDGKVIKEDGEEDADEEEEEVKKVQKSKKEESFDDEEEESEAVEEKAEETEEEEKPKSKLRMKMGDELFNVQSDATFKVKVDGSVLDVPVQELINNYSGKTAWDKKFTELGKEKKNIDNDKASIEKQKAFILDFVGKTLDPLKDPNKSPMDSLMYLVEMSGEDPYNAYRRIMESNLEELSSLLDMGETERELYFHKKKDELYGKVDKQRQEKLQKEQVFNQTRQKVDSLRQAHNVSEEEFVNAADELEEIFKAQGRNVGEISEEHVVDYASLKPHISKIQEMVTPYEDNISDDRYGDVVSELAYYLRDGKATEKDIAEILKRNFSVEEDVKELNTKVYQKQKAKVSKKVEVEEDSNGFESFSDWD
jgi:hypothetical protein